MSDVTAGMPPAIAYVAGYGRSGSTLLARLLGQSSGAIAAGELARYRAWIHSTRACSCGEPIVTCALWAAVRRELPRAAADGGFWRAMLESPLVLYLGFRWIPASARRRYRDAESALFRAVAGAARARVVIDSSKTARRAAGRAAALHEVAGLDVRVIHLVRNPQSVRASLERGTNKALEGRAPPRVAWLRARAFIGWAMANAFALRLTRRMPRERTHRIDYEGLVADPRAALAPVAAALGLSLADLEGILHGQRAARAEHLAEGNRMRLEPLAIAPELPVRVSGGDRFLGSLLCGGVCRRLGIPARGTPWRTDG